MENKEFDARALWKQIFPGWAEPNNVEMCIAERFYAAGLSAIGAQLSEEAKEAHRMLDIEGIECGPNHSEPRSLAYRIGLVFEKLEAAPAGQAELSEEQVIRALNMTSYEPGDFAPDCGSHSSTWVKRFTAALLRASQVGSQVAQLPDCGCEENRCFGPITGYRCRAAGRK